MSDIWLYHLQDWYKTVDEMSDFISTEQNFVRASPITLQQFFLYRDIMIIKCYAVIDPALYISSREGSLGSELVLAS